MPYRASLANTSSGRQQEAPFREERDGFPSKAWSDKLEESSRPRTIRAPTPHAAPISPQKQDMERAIYDADVWHAR